MVFDNFDPLIFAPGFISLLFFLRGRRQVQEDFGTYGKFVIFIFYTCVLVLFEFIDLILTRLIFNITYLGTVENIMITPPLPLGGAFLSWIFIGWFSSYYRFLQVRALSVRDRSLNFYRKFLIFIRRIRVNIPTIFELILTVLILFGAAWFGWWVGDMIIKPEITVAPPIHPHPIYGYVRLNNESILGANVTVINLNTKESRSFLTNQNGEYIIDLANLKLGYTTESKVKVTACINDTVCTEVEQGLSKGGTNIDLDIKTK